MSKWVCSGCQTENNGHARYCINCGSMKSGSSVEVSEPEWQCPVCRSLNHETSIHCVKCGHWLLSGINPAVRVKNAKEENHSHSGGGKRKSDKSELLIFAPFILGVLVVMYMIATVNYEEDVTEDKNIETGGSEISSNLQGYSQEDTSSILLLNKNSTRNETSVEVAESITVSEPNLNTIEVNKTERQNGVSIKLERIEFDETHTRVYLTIENNSNLDIYVDTHGARLAVGKTQYEAVTMYDTEYPEIQTRILPSIEMSGVITFPKVTERDNSMLFNIRVLSMSDERVIFKPYEYRVN